MEVILKDRVLSNTFEPKTQDGLFPTCRCILFGGENISFDASLVIYIYIYI
jgi:hypothetical protein